MFQHFKNFKISFVVRARKYGRTDVWTRVRKNVRMDVWTNVLTNVRTNIRMYGREKVGDDLLLSIEDWLQDVDSSGALDRYKVTFVRSADVWLQLKHECTNVRTNVRTNVWANVRSNVRTNVRMNVQMNVRTNVRTNVRMNG